MRPVICSYMFLSLALLLLLPVSAHAIPAITCHCFTDRSYDAAHPASADSYFLATTQNSFFAAVFNVEKRTLVMKKQQGTSSDDLWVAHWVASKTGTAPDRLLQSRLKSDSWKSVIVPLRLSSKIMGARFSNALNAGAGTDRLSEAVVEEIFLRERLLSERDLAGVRKAGATNQEMIIATVIATRMRRPTSQLYLEVKTGSRSWGALLSEAQIDTKNMQQEISAILKLSHP